MQIPFIKSYKGLLKLAPVFLVLVFAFGLIGYSPAQADPGWYNASWLYRKKIEIHSSNVTADQTDFPVLISITGDSDIGTHAQTDGDDLIFTQSDEVTEIPYEIESFSSDGSSANLTVWVKVSNLSSSSNTDIYMYYGNAGIGTPQEDPQNVWDDDFLMIQHLHETSGTHYDSTQYNNDGTVNITTPGTQNAAGKIDGADTFDGINDIIDFGSNASLQPTDNLTIELWINRTDNTTFERILSHSINSADYAFEFGVDVIEPEKWRFRLNNDAITLKAAMVGNPGQWLYVVGTYAKDAGGVDEMKIYENGNLIGTQDYSTAMTNHGSLRTNRQGKADGWLKSSVDEIRISGVARSAGWIQTSYNNQSNPSAFYTLHAEEGVPSAPTVATSAASNVEETTATLNGNITATGGENADTRGFEWDTDSGAPYSSNWTESGSFGTGTFPHGLTGLTRGELYFYRAMAHNSAGWAYGSEQKFLTKPDGPTGLTAVSHGTDWVYLTWSNGTGSDNITVQYLAGATYPGAPTSGTTGYFGPGTSANITGLSDNQTYSFRAWSFASEGGLGQWSDTYSSDSDTTDASGGAPPTVIGGKILIVNKAALLAPWVALAAVLSIIAVKVVRYLRKKLQLRSLSRKTD